LEELGHKLLENALRARRAIRSLVDRAGGEETARDARKRWRCREEKRRVAQQCDVTLECKPMMFRYRILYSTGYLKISPVLPSCILALPQIKW
jgi:hypothetical protein